MNDESGRYRECTPVKQTNVALIGLPISSDFYLYNCNKWLVEIIGLKSVATIDMKD